MAKQRKLSGVKKLRNKPGSVERHVEIVMTERHGGNVIQQGYISDRHWYENALEFMKRIYIATNCEWMMATDSTILMRDTDTHETLVELWEEGEDLQTFDDMDKIQFLVKDEKWVKSLPADQHATFGSDDIKHS
jgi:hypothetical protein